MSERRLQPVTRIRGELTPSLPVERAIHRFLEQAPPMGTMRLYTSSQALVERGTDRTRHARELSRLQREITARSMAQRAFVLALPMKLQAGADGSGRLFFDVSGEQRPLLEQFGERLEAIRGIETEPLDDEQLLYAEFARGALAQDLGRRQEQVAAGYRTISAELRHPTAPHRMTASGLRIVTRDLVYPVTERTRLPAAE